MMKELMVKLTGVAPMMMHNAQLANPLNEWAKKLKEISGKKKKTDDDYVAMSKIEWYGSLYTRKDEKGKSVIVLPSEVILGCIIGGAKQSKLGNDFKSGFDVPMDADLVFDGPQNIDKMWDDGRFTDVRGVRIQKNRIMRTRPIFMTWEATAMLMYRPDVLNESHVMKAVEDAGLLVGICDYRPRYGRFTAEKI